MSKQRRGFTIVELLIVIVVIGILAAITIVAFNGVTQRARVATISSDLEGAAKQLAIDQTLNSAYPATAAAANGGAGLKASPGTTYQYAVDNTASPQTFCITATNGTTSYYSSSTNNVPTVGACAGQGSGGVAAVTNLMPNPSAETGTTGFGASGGATISSVTDWAASGSRSFKVTTTTSTNQGDMRVASGGLGSPLARASSRAHLHTVSSSPNSSHDHWWLRQSSGNSLVVLNGRQHIHPGFWPQSTVSSWYLLDQLHVRCSVQRRWSKYWIRCRLKHIWPGRLL